MNFKGQRQETLNDFVQEAIFIAKRWPDLCDSTHKRDLIWTVKNPKQQIGCTLELDSHLGPF